MFVSLIRAGEESGQLTRVLAKVIENLKWQDEQAAYTKQLLTYPVIVTVFIFLALFFLMMFVVPKLVSFLATMGQTLPLQTRALIATSKFFTQYWYLVLFCRWRPPWVACLRSRLIRALPTGSTSCA